VINRESSSPSTEPGQLHPLDFLGWRCSQTSPLRPSGAFTRSMWTLREKFGNALYDVLARGAHEARYIPLHTGD
jgi:hypothetical protein